MLGSRSQPRCATGEAPLVSSHYPVLATRRRRPPAAAQAAAGAGAGAAPSSSSPRPTRGVLILPGLGNNAADYAPLAASLRAQQGVEVEVAPINRPDWGRNAAALTDANWWRSTLKPRPAVDWYLNKVDEAATALKRRTNGAPITLLTHSAGGWLGRVYLKDYDRTGIDRFVSLGSPHAPPPPGVVDQTRGILSYCADACPGAFHANVKYATVAGRFVKGVKLTGRGGWVAKFAGAGYQQVAGDAEVWGDFIVPCTSAHLDGAVNIDLEGIFHSPLGEKLPYFGPWYGSDDAMRRWLPYAVGDWPAAGAVEYVFNSAELTGGAKQQSE